VRIAIAGGTGAIGTPTVRRLLAAKHDVTLLVRPGHRELPPGVPATTVDFFDAQAVRTAIDGLKPHAVISHVTSLPKEIRPRGLRATYERNDRARKDAGEHLARAAAAAGARPIVSTVAFWYEPGPGEADETTPLWLDAPEPIRRSVWTLIELETALELSGAVVLRCGSLIGPGTYYDRAGSFGKRLATGRYPIIGTGAGVTSFVHVDDVAEATLHALDLPPSTYNVVDDEPAASRVWIAEFAAAYGGPTPKTVPPFAAKLMLGQALVEWNARSRGASNAKLRATGWAPTHPSWRKALLGLG